MKHKIILFSCYFGKLPNWFNLLIDSLGKNSNIDFMFFTDSDFDNKYPNIKKRILNLKEFKTLIQKKFDFNIELSEPYKICDYRPAFGYIFSDYIKEYDFWGHFDIDIIMGDMPNFLTDDVLDKYGKIFKLGHLTLYKNNKFINNLFMHGKDELNYKFVFSNKKNLIFDELNGIQKIFDEFDVKTMDGDCIYDITPKHYLFTVSTLSFSEKKMEHFKNFKNQFFIYEQGKIYRCYKIGKTVYREEGLYIHFQKRKLIVHNPIYKDNYIINNSGFWNINTLNTEDRNIFKRIVWHITHGKIYLKIKKIIHRGDIK